MRRHPLWHAGGVSGQRERAQSLLHTLPERSEVTSPESRESEAADPQDGGQHLAHGDLAGWRERYIQQELLARGGSAEIYRAIDQLTGTPVALKLLLPALANDRTARARIRREGAVLRKYHHVGLPNLISVLSEPVGLVLEYIAGLPLSQALAEAGRWPAPNILPIYDALLAVLAFLHQGGIVHRDIKPSNILLPRDTTDRSVVKLIDWGLASRVQSPDRADKLTRSGIPIGTPLYMSPEHCQGRGIDEKSDVYCLGLVLFEMLTGHPPFSGSTPVNVMMAQLAQPLPDWRTSDPLERFLYDQAHRMTRKDPNERPTISTLRDKLRPHLAQA